MALNGGVSLAIWMGGCAVELDAARRGHLGPETLAVDAPSVSPIKRHGAAVVRKFVEFVRGAPPPAPPAPAGERTVYSALCEAFRREFVVDLMSGASAGGINGALLASATVNGRRLHPDFVRDKWLELGDISLLLQRTSRPDPRSLMRGREFHANLLATFLALTDDEGADRAAQAMTCLPTDQALRNGDRPRLVPLLDVTTTDLEGVERVFKDKWGGVLVARQYRARFAFRKLADYSAPNLATAARSSASFPFAFEPWSVDQDAGALAGFREPRLVIDGGLLDNAPIKAVIDLIPERGTERQVKRFVCYLNADPPSEAAAADLAEAVDLEEVAQAAPPTLFGLAKACLSLPLKAPFVDQLDAIARSTRRSSLACSTEVALLAAPATSLAELAQALLPVYRRRRRLLSLEELLEHSADVRAAWDKLHGNGPLDELPWVPLTLADDPRSRWGWGLRAAQRAIHLLVDALRQWIEAAEGARDRERLMVLLNARARLYEQLAILVAKREALLGDAEILAGVARLAEDGADTPKIVAKLSGDWCRYDKAAAAAVRAAAEVTLAIAPPPRKVFADETPANAPPPDEAGERVLDREQLFGSSGDVDVFIQRARYVEVIRRSFDSDRDIDTAQEVGFVQLTPFTDIPIFRKPGAPACPSSPRDKLAGIQLGHFAAFYRRAWRANDYMWGRLDASTRIVELLVDHERACDLARYDGVPAPWDCLARTLVPHDASDDQIWLVREILGDDSPTAPAALCDQLTTVLRQDLTAGQGDITRLICTRAVQLEILAQELPVLDKASATDRKLGASSKPLGLDLRGALSQPIGELRPATGELSLPVRLGARGRMEVGSNLGLRTATHALFVVLAALRFAKLPLARMLYVLRAVLFPIAGTVSRVGWYRFAVLIGFWAAALFITVRVVRAREAPVEVGDLWTKPILLSVIALLAAIGVIAVPLIRAVSGGAWMVRLGNLATGVALAAVGGIGAITLALANGVDADNVLTGSGAPKPPDPLMTAIIGAVLGLPVLRRFTAVQSFIARRIARRKLGGALSVAVLAGFTGWLAAWGLRALSGYLDASSGWRSAAAWAAVVGLPLAAGAYLGSSWLSGRTFDRRGRLRAALRGWLRSAPWSRLRSALKRRRWWRIGRGGGSGGGPTPGTPALGMPAEQPPAPRRRRWRPRLPRLPLRRRRREDRAGDGDG